MSIAHLNSAGCLTDAPHAERRREHSCCEGTTDQRLPDRERLTPNTENGVFAVPVQRLVLLLCGDDCDEGSAL